MSQPSSIEMGRLRAAAHELVEVFAERGYRIEVAQEVDAGFSGGGPRSALARALATDALSAAASHQGLDFRPVNGSGREVRIFSDGVDRRFRFRKATKRVMDGSYIIPANTDSALTGGTDDFSLIPEETWVLGYTRSSDDLAVEDVFVAPVRGTTEGSPGHLVLGPVIDLLGGDTPVPGFRPNDEPLEGFEDDEDEDGTGTGTSWA